MRNSRYIYQILLSTIIIISLWSCASQKPATGGPKDINPPTLDTTYPVNYSKDFSYKELQIVFDERIQENNINRNLIINPNTENIEFSSTIRKNKLILKWDHHLKDNTTYTFNFKKCIKDVTEGNESQDLYYVFSTGNELDTLTIKGILIDEIKNSKISKAQVGLYLISDTLDIKKQKPLYITYSNEAGEFEFKHLPQQEYELYAIEDQNSNRKYESNETIGYLGTSLNPETDTSVLRVSCFKDDKLKPSIKTKSTYNNLINLRYDEDIIEFRLLDTAHQKLELPFLFRKEPKDYIIYGNDYDNKYLYAVATDIYQNIDTSMIKLSKESDSIPKADIIVKLENNFYKHSDTIKLNLNHSIDSLIKDSIRITLDTNNYYNFKVQISDNQIIITNIDTVENNIKIAIAANGIYLGRYNLTNKPFVNVLSTYKKENYGSVNGKVFDTTGTPLILELIDQANRPIRKVNSGSFNFINLSPGSYKLKIYRDINKDGKWTPGSFDLRRLPEPILYYEPIQIKANWKIEELEISVHNLSK